MNRRSTALSHAATERSAGQPKYIPDDSTQRHLWISRYGVLFLVDNQERVATIRARQNTLKDDIVLFNLSLKCYYSGANVHPEPGVYYSA